MHLRNARCAPTRVWREHDRLRQPLVGDVERPFDYLRVIAVRALVEEHSGSVERVYPVRYVPCMSPSHHLGSESSPLRQRIGFRYVLLLDQDQSTSSIHESTDLW